MFGQFELFKMAAGRHIENGHRYNYKTYWSRISSDMSKLTNFDARNPFLHLFLTSEDSKLRKSKMASDPVHKTHDI